MPEDRRVTGIGMFAVAAVTIVWLLILAWGVARLVQWAL